MGFGGDRSQGRLLRFLLSFVLAVVGIRTKPFGSQALYLVYKWFAHPTKGDYIHVSKAHLFMIGKVVEPSLLNVFQVA